LDHVVGAKAEESAGSSPSATMTNKRLSSKSTAVAKLPTLMPIPMSGSLVIRQNSTHYAVFSMHGTDVRYEMVNGDDSQAGSVVVQADGVRPAVLFDDNRLSVIVTGTHDLVDSATFVRQGQVLLSVDARFLSTEWAGGFVGCMAGFMA